MPDDSENVASEWSATMDRCCDILPLFEGSHLSLLVTAAETALGLPDKNALHRMLASRRLPPFSSLRNWCYVVWLVDHFARGQALADWALSRGDSTSGYYALVKQTTGHSWTEVKAQGPVWVRSMALKVWAPYL